MKFKVFVQADSIQRGHEDDLMRQSFSPECGFIAKIIDFPDDQEPPDELLQAHGFANDAEAGTTMAIDLERALALGRRPVIATFPGRFNGQAKLIRYLVGFTNPQFARDGQNRGSAK